MNNHPLYFASNMISPHLSNRTFFLFCVLASLIFTNNASAQKTVWRYVTTVPNGTKGYLNDEVKTSANGNKSAWEKMVATDGSSIIALVEWDCRNKRRLTKQITFYNAAQSATGTTKKQFEWSEIIPGSSAEFIYRRVCLPAQTPKWAQINTVKANLRSFPDESASVLRIAKQGDRFQIVPETGQGGWYNVVDAVTQEDYWLHGNTFEIVETTDGKQKTSHKERPLQPAITQKSKVKSVKNQRKNK
jgi:hypothetical protein